MAATLLMGGTVGLVSLTAYRNSPREKTVLELAQTAKVQTEALRQTNISLRSVRPADSAAPELYGRARGKMGLVPSAQGLASKPCPPMSV